MPQKTGLHLFSMKFILVKTIGGGFIDHPRRLSLSGVKRECFQSAFKKPSAQNHFGSGL